MCAKTQYRPRKYLFWITTTTARGEKKDRYGTTIVVCGMAAVVFQLQTREKRVRKKGVETSGAEARRRGLRGGRGANILSFLAPPLEPPSSKHTPPARGSAAGAGGEFSRPAPENWYAPWKFVIFTTAPLLKSPSWGFSGYSRATRSSRPEKIPRPLFNKWETLFDPCAFSKRILCNM